MSFGSDPSFSSTHFQGPSSDIQYDKNGNLLNVPLADKARSPFGSHPFPTLNGPQSASVYGSSAPMQNAHQGGASWGSLRPAGQAPRHNVQSGNTQARKRRKSQAVQDDEQEWTPANSAIKIEESDDDDDTHAPSSSRLSNKRRRLTDSRLSQVSNSPPADDDDEETAARKKRGSKKRDNLTEEEKRRNHIQSEKKRREIIQQGYSELNKLVPCLASGKSGLSRSECLQEIASYLEVLIHGTNSMMLQTGQSNHDAELAVINRQMKAAADAIEK